eukprot:c3304_g1_i1.p1 GENE.c3304_g1_i1~~c3304_g1_i1.p1  ORF type:complete len:536 (+),score=107.26 c3304_g1_i1:146-1609(+)
MNEQLTNETFVALGDNTSAGESTDNASDIESPKVRLYFFTLLIFSTSFLLTFTAFGGVQNLETSLDLGTASGHVVVGLVYVFFTVGCLFAPKIVSILGSKMCIFLQEVDIAIFIAAHFYPSSYTLYPSASLIGIGSAMMWVGQGEFVSFLAKQHEQANNTKQKKHKSKNVAGQFQGIFFALFQSSQVTGNIISSILFTLSSSSGGPSPAVMRVMFGVYLICACTGAALLFFFVKSSKALSAQRAAKQMLENSNVKDATTDIVSAPIGILDPLKLALNPKIALLIPMFLVTGLECGFAWGDLTNKVIKPALGEANIGFAMAVYGACDAFFSFLFGRVSDKLGRPLIALSGFLCHAACSAALLLRMRHKATNPLGSEWAPVLTICAFWGIGDAVWNTIISATLGTCFPASITEASFGLFRMFMALGVSIAFFSGEGLSVSGRLWMFLVVLGVAAVCYVINVTVFGLERKKAAARAGKPSKPEAKVVLVA